MIAKLPKGHDDLQSWYFIPEQYREAWLRHAPDAQERTPIAWTAVARTIALFDIARERAAQTGAARDERPTFDIVAAMATEVGTPMWGADYSEHDVQERLTSDTSYRQRAEHAICAAYVKQTHDAEREQQMKLDAAAERVACPVCGDLATGFPMTRPLLDKEDRRSPVDVAIASTIAKPVPELHSCLKCFEVAKAIYIEEMRAEALLPDGRTREAKIRALLFQPNFGRRAAS
ncbi:MAG: hypothetical protein EAS51_12795 [Microbacteriaceae bacterium]|nr:MAG: hypothetical protein EAS51_12795 [Microbacteriaceae bacterium]